MVKSTTGLRALPAGWSRPSSRKHKRCSLLGQILGQIAGFDRTAQGPLRDNHLIIYCPVLSTPAETVSIPVPPTIKSSNHRTLIKFGPECRFGIGRVPRLSPYVQNLG
jgi:hypothetical protein